MSRSTQAYSSLIPLVICTIGMAGCSSPEPIEFEFRNIKIGMPVSEIPADALEEQRVSEGFVSGNVRLPGFTDYIMFQASVIGDRVESIILLYSESDYFQLKRAIIEKFGKPHRTSMIAGNETITWFTTDGEFHMDNMHASISSAKAGELSRQNEAARKNGIQDSI